MSQYNLDLSNDAYLLQSYAWEMHLTTELPNYPLGTDTDSSNTDAHIRFVNEILLPLSQHLRQRLASISVVVPPQFELREVECSKFSKPTFKAAAHIHTLLLSEYQNIDRRNDTVQSWLLDNHNPSTLLKNHQSCLAVPISNHDTTDPSYFRNVTRYVSKNFLENLGATRHTYRPELLSKRLLPAQERFQR